jgi:hypothetical protein
MVSISLAGIAQGVMVSSYTVGTNYAGITSATNAQAGQAVDVTNVRDQIQLTATLNPNGQSVDSVVAFIANADGSNRTAAARQSFSGGSAASGNLTFVINTADFTADFTAGTAAVRFANGARQISVSAFSGTAEQRSTNSQTLAFNNVDGYAASVTAPKSAVSAAGLTWHGGPDSVTATLGSTTVVPVYYTAGRTLARATLSMRQGALGDTQACSEILEFQTGPYKFVYGGARAVFLDATVVDCSELQSDLDHVVGVTAATDGAGAPAPSTTYAAGFRSSTTVPAPTALRLDYGAPSAGNPYTTQTFPAVTGWVNGSWSFDLLTDAATDVGIGMPGTTGTTAAAVLSRKANRVWSYRGCGIGSAASGSVAAVYLPLTGGSSAAITPCATDLVSANLFTIAYTDADKLGNTTVLKTATVSVDNVAPVVTWNLPTDSIQKGSLSAVTYTAAVSDDRSGISDTSAVTGYVGRQADGIGTGGTTLYEATNAPNQRLCYDLNGTARAGTTSGATYPQADNVLTCSASLYRTALQPLDGNGRRSLVATFATVEDASMKVSVSVTDKAGNTSAASTRRAMHDNEVPVYTITQPSAGVNASTIPVFPVTFQDRKIKDAYLVINYDGVAYRYPAKTIGNGAFGALTPVQGNVGTTTVAATAGATTLTMPYTGTFVIATQSGATAGTVTSIGTALANGADEAGNSGTTASPASLTTVAPTAITATSGTFVVLNALTAAGGAEAGLKAQLTGAATTTTNPYTRVDFYRQLSGGERVYLGSSATPTASLTGTPATTPVFTWKIDSYTTDFAGLANAPASTGDIIVAMGVRSTGAADLTGTSVIGGAAIKVTFAGLPVGVSATATLTGTNGFSQTIVSPNGSVTVPVVNGSYTLIGAGSVTSSTGEIYTTISANSGDVNQTFNVVGDAGIITANTYTYQLAAANRLSVKIVGLPSNLTPAALTLSKAGTPSLTVIGYNGTNTFSVPSAGSWSVSAAPATVAGTVHLARALVPLAYTATLSGSVVTTGTAMLGAGLGLATVGDVLAYATGALVGTISSVSTVSLTMGAAVTTATSATQLYFYREELPSTHGITALSTTVTAAASSSAFTDVGVGDRFEQTDYLLLGTVASKTSAEVVNFAAASTAAATAGTTVLHVVKAAIAPVTVTTGATANAAANLIQYTSATLGSAAGIRTTAKSNAPAGVTLTPKLRSASATFATHAVLASGETGASVFTAVATGASVVVTADSVLGSDGNRYGNSAYTHTVTSAVGGTTVNLANYYAARVAVKFAGTNVGDLAGYTVPISYVGPQGTLAAVTRAITTSAGSTAQVPSHGTYSVAAIAPIVLGNYTYTFVPGTVSAVYADAAAEITVAVTRTALPASLGVTAVAASSTAAWTDATIATTRTLTPTLTAGASFVATPTCVARTASGGSVTSTLITTSVNAVTGVCTLTGVAGTAANVYITWTGTAAGVGLSTTTETVEFTIARTAL